MEISEILWKTSETFLKQSIKNVCDEYENNEKYKILKIKENNEIVGFAVYHEIGEYRHLSEAHYLGKNKYIALKMWRWLTKNANKLRIIVQKSNHKMIKFYIKMNFKIISQDLNNLYLERY